MGYVVCVVCAFFVPYVSWVSCVSCGWWRGGVLAARLVARELRDEPLECGEHRRVVGVGLARPVDGEDGKRALAAQLQVSGRLVLERLREPCERLRRLRDAQLVLRTLAHADQLVVSIGQAQAVAPAPGARADAVLTLLRLNALRASVQAASRSQGGGLPPGAARLVPRDVRGADRIGSWPARRGSGAGR